MTLRTTREHVRDWRRECGQAMVEFALVVPLFIMMSFAILEFGAYMMNSISISRAADVGARAGALKGANSSSAIGAASDAIPTLVSCAVSTPTASYAGTPSMVTVTTACTYSPITPVGALAGIALPTAIAKTVVMRVEP